MPDLESALRGINNVVFPWEDNQVRARMGVDTALEKVLIIFGEWRPGRTTVVLVRKPWHAARTDPDANLLLWIEQILLALAFLSWNDIGDHPMRC